MKSKQSVDVLAGFLLVFLGSIMFSAKAVMVKLAYRYGIDPVSLLLLRMLFALPFYAITLVWIKRKDRYTPLDGRKWLLIISLGIVGYYLASYFDFAGLQYISAGLERLILFIYPTLVLLLSALFFKKKVTPLQVVAILLTYGGIIYAYREDVQIGEVPQMGWGAFLIFMSALTYALYLIGMGKMLNDISPTQFTAIAMIVSCLFVVAHFSIMTTNSVWNYPVEVYGLAILMAILSTVVPSFLLSAGMQSIGSSNASIVSSVGPVSTIVLAYFFLNEGFSWQQGVAVVMVIGGVLLVSQSKKLD